jgi:hypothetical protein
MESKPKKLLDQVRELIRLKHYSYRTEQTYVQWIRRYILFHNKRHPKDMGVPEIEAFLSHLATTEQVAASTQNQAFSALLFLYHQVLQIPLDERSPLPSGRKWIAESPQASRYQNRNTKARQLSHLPSLLRHPSLRKRL